MPPLISGSGFTAKPPFPPRPDLRRLYVMSGGKIFISYRRADSQWAAARLHDTLANAFPDDHLFMDVEHIAPGQDFVDVLADQVGACDVFLALVGPDWLTLTNEAGNRRLDDPDDFVRIEIASALTRVETLTIPVLLDGASPPTEAALPPDLTPLARRQFLRLTHEGFRSEVQLLVEAIREKLASAPAQETTDPKRPFNWRIPAGLAAATLIGVAGFLGWQAATTPPDPSGTPDLASFRECESCPEMIAIPAGSYMMGSAPDDPFRSESEGPQRQMTIPKFALASTELTRLKYDACAEAGACEKLPRFGQTKPGDPATHIRWIDAQAYVAWLNTLVPGTPYRLPSESEWEYAARAGTTTLYPWGDEPDRAFANLGREICCIGSAEGPDKWEGVAPVARFKPNPWGLYDMMGNLSEWMQDVYESDLEDGPTNGEPYFWEGDNRWARRHVLKGGGYGDRPWETRPAARQSNDREWVLGGYGMRVARDMMAR